jgi:hypothetical protein
VLVLVLVVQLFLVALVRDPASAAVGSADDRQLTTSTGWWTYTGVTGSQVSSLLSSNNARITDLSVVDPATPTFNVTMVRNTGAYASGYWWYYGQTAAQVSSALSSNNARLITAQAYPTSAGTRFAVVMVPNSGANQKAWWWFYNISASSLASQLSSRNARLVHLTQYPGTSNFTAVMVSNTGTDNTGWWWYHHTTTSSISSALSTNTARLVDLSRNSDGTWNAVMYKSTGPRWYWYYGLSLGSAVSRADQLGERIIDVTRYGSSVAVVMTRNTSATNEKLWNLIGPKVDSGAYGFYLKQVGGSVLAGLQQSKQYEPASALKVLYHAKSIREESLGNTTDSTMVTYHYKNLSDSKDGNICPDNYSTTTTTNLKNADTLMMQVSDNRMTRGILEKYTKASMLSYGTSLGLTSTAINHNIGCPTDTTHNRTTLSDLGKVYEAFQKGTVTSSSTWKTQFRSRMLNQSNFSGFKNAICPVVNAEATALGRSSATATSFCNAMTWIAKGGSYQYGSSLPYQVSRDNVSLTGVPYKRSGVVSPRYFVFGEYVDGTTINTSAESTSVDTARGKLYPEALRPYIRAALATW